MTVFTVMLEYLIGDALLTDKNKMYSTSKLFKAEREKICRLSDNQIEEWISYESWYIEQKQKQKNMLSIKPRVYLQLEEGWRKSTWPKHDHGRGKF